MEIRPITDADLTSVANIHILAFPDATLSKLGLEAAQRYYSSQLNGQHDSLCIIGAFVDTKMTGFCFAGVFRGGEAGFLYNNWAYLLWCFMTRPWLLANEMVRNSVIDNIHSVKRHISKQKQESKKLTASPVNKKFGILSIAVHPQYQRLGIGKLLMKEVEAEARHKGFSSMRLTVHPDNYKTVLFYEKQGWQKIKSADGMWSGHMAKDIETNVKFVA